MTQFGLDVVRGTVIGDFHKTARLFYDGRPQGPAFHGESDAELRVQAVTHKARIKEELGETEFTRLYPADKWEMRIWD